MKKLSIILTSIIFICLTFGVTSAYSVWAFKTDESASHAAHLYADAIGDNVALDDVEQHVSYANEKYYNVYFLAQAVQNFTTEWLAIDEANPEVDGQTNYQFVKDANGNGPYYKPNASSLHDYSYGKFEGAKNPLMRDVKHVTYVSKEKLAEIGKPVIDRRDQVNWHINFYDWSLTPYSCYGQSIYPTNYDSFQFNTLLSYYDSRSIMINGYPSFVFFPFITNGKDYRSAYITKNPDEAADEVIIYEGAVEGYQDEKRNAWVGSIFDTNIKGIIDQHFVPETTGSVPANDTYRYRAYRFSNYEITQEMMDFPLETRSFAFGFGFCTYSSYDINWEDKERWPKYIEYKDESNVQRILRSTDIGAGTYNIYVFVKSLTSLDYKRLNECVGPRFELTNGEITQVYSALEYLNIVPYRMFNSVVGYAGPNSKSKYNNYRDCLVVVQKLYSPDLIGGNYEGDIGFSLFGQSGATISSEYLINNVTLNDSNNGYFDYQINEDVTLEIPDYYFSLGLNNGQDDIDNFHLGRSPGRVYDVPTYTYYDLISNTICNENYRDNLMLSLHDSLTNVNSPDLDKIYVNVNGVRTKYNLYSGSHLSDVNAAIASAPIYRPYFFGFYSLFVNFLIDYVDGVTTITADIWAMRFHNYHVTIYDPRDFGGAPYGYGTDLVYNENLKSRYSYRTTQAYYGGADIRYSSDVFVGDTGWETQWPNFEYTGMIYGVSNSAIDPPSRSPSVYGSSITFLELLAAYELEGMCLYNPKDRKSVV